MKKTKWQLFTLLFELVIGLAAIIAYVILAFAGETGAKTIITLLLAAFHVAMAIQGLIWYRKPDDGENET